MSHVPSVAEQRTVMMKLTATGHRIKKLSLCAIAAAMVVALPACEIENPSAVKVDTSDPTLLIRGARSKFSDAMGMIGSAFVASDEGVAKSSFQYEDETGDISLAGAYTTWYSQVHQARSLAAFAIARAEATNEPEVGLLAQKWHGWVLLRLAELWGTQPFDGGPPVPVEEIWTRALADLDVAKSAKADSTRQRALAGLARINWTLGRNPVDRTRLTAAIADAQKVLDEKPSFIWVEAPNFNPFSFPMGRSYGPAPFYKDIPLWFAGFPQFAGHDTTLTFNDKTKPQGVVMIDADELRLIQAEAHLLLGDLAAAKAAFKRTALLPINRVRVGRQPKDPLLTQAQINAFVDPLSATALRQAIEDLRRENQYLSARRSVGSNGQTIMPFKLPPNA